MGATTDVHIITTGGAMAIGAITAGTPLAAGTGTGIGNRHDQPPQFRLN